MIFGCHLLFKFNIKSFLFTFNVVKVVMDLNLLLLVLRGVILCSFMASHLISIRLLSTLSVFHLIPFIEFVYAFVLILQLAI